MLIRQNLNKINILILLVLIQSFLYSSKDKKDNVLDNFIPNANLAKLISDYSKVDWQLYKTIDAKAEVRGRVLFDISLDGKYLACGYNDGKIKIWSSENGKLLTNFAALNNSNMLDIAFSQPDGKYLAVAHSWQFVFFQVRGIKILDSKTGKELYEIANYTSPVYSKNGKYLAARGQDNIGIFNTIDYSIFKKFPDIKERPDGLLFAPNNKYLAYSILKKYSSALESDVIMLNIDTNKERNLFSMYDDSTNVLSFSNDSKYIALGSMGGKSFVLDVETAKLIHTFLNEEDHLISAVQFSRNDEFFASAYGSTLKIWDFETKNLLKEINEKDGSINFVNFLPNNSLVYVHNAYYGNQQIKIWQYKSKGN